MTTRARKLCQRTRISAPTHEGKQQQKVEGVTPAALISGSCLLDSTPEVLTTVLKPGIAHEGPHTRAHSSKGPGSVPPGGALTTTETPTGGSHGPTKRVPLIFQHPRGTCPCAEARSAPPGPKYFRSLLKGT